MTADRAVILKYELKKIMTGRIAVIAVILGAGMLLAVTMINYLIIRPQDVNVYEREISLEGRPLDDAFLEEVAAEAEKAGGLSKIGAESRYYHAAGYLNRLQGTYLTIGGASAETLKAAGKAAASSSGTQGLTADSLYALREDLLEYIYDYFRLSDSDKEWWKEKENRISKPFVWHTNFGVYSMKSNFGAAMDLFCIIAGVSLAGVFAGEKSQRTDSLVLCTKEGKKTLWLIKFAAGEIFSLTAGTLLLAAVQLPHVIFNGLHGTDAAWQLLVPFSSYPYTAGHMLALLILDYYLGCLLTGAAAMLLSVLIGNAVASAGVICVAVMLDLFAALPPQLGLLAQLRYLTPGQVLLNSGMADPRLLHIFGLRLTSIQSAAVLYAAATILFMIIVRAGYKRLEA